MGRKQSKRAAPKKGPKAKLERSFACPFCHHEAVIECKLDRQRQIGSTNCRICSAGYQTVINYLSEPVDVYAEWIDAIDAQEQKKASQTAENQRRRSLGNDREQDTLHQTASGKRKKVDESDEDDERANFDEDDLVDYRDVPERQKQKTAKKAKSRTQKEVFGSDEEESEEYGSESDDDVGAESEGKGNSDSESEADFTDSGSDD